jgi:TRAP-type C4-dicarboxylate transport system permease small subunit
VLVERLAPRPRRRLRRATDAFGAAVCALLAVYAGLVLWRSYAAHNMVQQTFVFPEWYLYVIAPPVFAILAAEFVRRAVRGQAGA